MRIVLWRPSEANRYASRVSPVVHFPTQCPWHLTPHKCRYHQRRSGELTEAEDIDRSDDRKGYRYVEVRISPQ